MILVLQYISAQVLYTRLTADEEPKTDDCDGAGSKIIMCGLFSVFTYTAVLQYSSRFMDSTSMCMYTSTQRELQRHVSNRVNKMGQKSRATIITVHVYRVPGTPPKMWSTLIKYR